MKSRDIVTLGQFIVNQQNKFPDAKGGLSRIFRSLELATKIVNKDVRRAGLIDILGSHGETNIQGETQQKLDVRANDVFIAMIEDTQDCAAILSEENNDVYYCTNSLNAKYILCMDPLDGSSNIDVNASIGTIFSIYERKHTDTDVSLDECLQSGINQVAAGYTIYGSSTMMVYTTGSGVNGFTLDDSIHEFCLSHPDIKIPEEGKIYSINEGNWSTFPQGIRDYINFCKSSDGKDAFSARYIGSLIADFHRNLLKGGIFLYPATENNENGKLRLMYECNPMSFIIEQAGGKSSTGTERIMEIQPTELHQRVPLITGSKNMVKQVEVMLQ